MSLLEKDTIALNLHISAVTFMGKKMADRKTEGRQVLFWLTVSEGSPHYKGDGMGERLTPRC